MPFRPGIISSGEDHPGETVRINREMRKRLKPVPVLREYEDEEALFDHADQLRQDDAIERYQIAAVRNYIIFWSMYKYQECDHERCPLCLSCLKGHNRFVCLCEGGKRMVSPYRLTWLNSAERQHWQTKIWLVGYGYVPKNKREVRSPRFDELNW